MNHTKKIKTACSLDCFDGCSLVATVSNNKVIAIEGDKNHPLTKGFCCHKGQKIVERTYHLERLKKPLRKRGKGFGEITWDQALDEISENIEQTVKRYGSESILLYSGYGYTGILKDADRMFFNYLGGVSVHCGSLCMGAGVAAQKFDFGQTRSNLPKDCLNSRAIIIWGRNPAITNIHLYSYIKKASKKGISIVTIDPVKTATAAKSDHHIGIKPGTDGALAFGISAEIVRSGREDISFLKNHTKGYDGFKESLLFFTLQKTAEITGIDIETIKLLADIYCKRPVSTYIGFGMQRCKNGGNNVRSIDALGAISGNIGIKGGGVNYGHSQIPDYLNSEYDKSKVLGVNSRYYNISKIPEFIEQADPSIQSIFISKANPLVQNPNIQRLKKSIESIHFKVVTDMFMTDTAKTADIVLPCTSVLEEEDLFYSSMFTPYLNYSEKVIEPDHKLLSEYNFYQELAKRLNLKDYPYITESEYLERATKPACEKFNLTFEDIKKGDFNPSKEIAWENKIFLTPSKKFEFYSEKAKVDGVSPMAEFIGTLNDSKFPFRLITPHSVKSLHSQHYQHLDDEPYLHMNNNVMTARNLKTGDIAHLTSKNGRMEVKVKLDNSLDDGVVMIYQGFRNEKGSVNILTSEEISDMGDQTSFYDCFCNISQGKD
jgi:anaerobic selenocysteine-containing dehydrogenase